MFVCVCVCLHVRSCVCGCVPACMHVCVCVCAPMCTWVCMCTCACTFVIMWVSRSVYPVYMYVMYVAIHILYCFWRRASHSCWKHICWILQILILTYALQVKGTPGKRELGMVLWITWSHTLCITWYWYCFHTQRDTGVLTHQTFVKLKKAGR